VLGHISHGDQGQSDSAPSLLNVALAKSPNQDREHLKLLEPNKNVPLFKNQILGTLAQQQNIVNPLLTNAYSQAFSVPEFPPNLISPNYNQGAGHQLQYNTTISLAGALNIGQSSVGHAVETKKQTQFRHVLLGNHQQTTSPRKDPIAQTVNEDDDENVLYFVPDFITELHTKLTKLQLEYAWLLEESHYLFQDYDPWYCYRYASPFLKMEFRKKDCNNIIPCSHQEAFEAKRRDVRRSLQKGHRRGPIMSRVLAKLRFAQRRKQT